MPTTYFRLVKTNPPTRHDFLSYEALGIPVPNPTPENLRKAKGVSVDLVRGQSAHKARKLARLQGMRYIAELVVPDESSITVEGQGSSSGHRTLYGDPDELLACVESVNEVD